VLVKAASAYFSKPRSKVYKTVNCYLTSETTSNPSPDYVQMGAAAPPGYAGYPGYAFFALPAFTRSVTVLRFPNTAALNFLVHDGIRPVDYVQLAASAPAPVITILGTENIIGVSSPTSGDKVSMLKLVCEIGI
jgi:hypothetical protein